MRSTSRREAGAAGAEPPAAPEAASPVRAARRRVAAFLLLLLSIGVVAGAFLSLSAATASDGPIGGDTPHYIWRATLVAEEGLDALEGSGPALYKPQSYRPGYPVLAGFLRSVEGIDPLDLTFAYPAIMAVIVGLGAGALAVQGLREPGWAFAVYAILVATSAPIVMTAVGRADNLLVDGLLVAAAVLALLAADGRPSIAGGVLLLAAAALGHWVIALYFLGVLGALAVALVPESIRARRSGATLSGTPAGRLAALLGGAAVVGGAGMLLAPSAPGLPSSPELWQHRIFPKLRLHRVGLAALALPAAVGSVLLFRRGGGRRRRGLLLLVIWAGSGLVALVAATGSPVPAHRILPVALGIPLLAAAGVVRVARLLAGLRPAAAWKGAAAAVVLLALAGGVFVGRGSWRSPLSGLSEMLAQSRTAGRYLEAEGTDRPVVFVSGRQGLRGAAAVVRAGLPAEEMHRAYVYVGNVQALLEGRPTLREGRERFNRLSLDHWEALQPVLDDDPIVVALAPFNPRARSLEGTDVAPGVTVVRGPTDVAIEPAPPPASPGAARSIAIVAGALALLWAVGFGWSVGFVPTGWLTRAALAPSLGIAVLVLGGVAASRVGLGGPGARPWLTVFLVLLGWALAVARALRRRRGAAKTPTETIPGAR